MSILALLIYKYSVEVVSRDLLITTRTNSRFTGADLRFKLLHIFIDDCDRLYFTARIATLSIGSL